MCRLCFSLAKYPKKLLPSLPTICQKSAALQSRDYRTVERNNKQKKEKCK